MKKIILYRGAFAAVATGAVIAAGILIIDEYTKSVVPGTPPARQEEQAPVETPSLFQYIEVLEGCGSSFGGPCVNMRSGPGLEYPVVSKLRIGVVLKVAETVMRDLPAQAGGSEWYRISFAEGVRYPERVTGDWFVSAEVVHMFYDDGDHDLTEGAGTQGAKRIIVDRSEQMLYAYDGMTLFMRELISTGLDLTPTPRGMFTVYRKTPSRYMQGPLPGISDQYYDLPGVPWNLYFTLQGGVIHGAYWHDNFGQPWSHGCVNLPPGKAKELYQWADVGTSVLVRD